MFNRLARSCFYEAQKNFDGCMPLGDVSEEVRDRAVSALRSYDALMREAKLHSVVSTCDEFIRWSNKYWADRIKAADAADDVEARRAVLRDSFYLLRVCTLMMHPVVPTGCELIGEHLDVDFGKLFSWEGDFAGNDELLRRRGGGGGRPSRARAAAALRLLPQARGSVQVAYAFLNRRGRQEKGERGRRFGVFPSLRLPRLYRR